MSNDDKIDQPPFRFIRDDPSDEDFFGSHGKIAVAIAESILANPELKTIGLLGRWGSGKSTIVKQTQKYLEGKADLIETHFFYYDAWLHQSDPPRRSFLETFLTFLVSKEFVAEAAWRDQLDKLNGAVKDETVTTRPDVTFAGLLGFLSLLVVPIGMKILTDEAFQKAVKPYAKWQDFIWFLLGIGMLVAPVVAAIGFYIFKLATKGRDAESHPAFAILTNKLPETKKTRTVKDLEPTAIEFQEKFGKILEEIHKPGRRFVLVIDNLDRLNEREAITMWTTIRSFFLGPNQAEDCIDKLPVVILPVDEESIVRLYRDQNSDTESADHLAQMFMEKTFDLTFRVTPPVQSGWKAYLERRFIAVFGKNVDKSWIADASQLFERSRQRGDNITPRSINVAINAIATLWLERREDGIPFPSIVYYTLFRASLKNSIVQAINSPNAHLADLDPDWARSIVALHYGVTTDLAFQVLIEDQLRAGIQTTTTEEFSALASTPGFGGAFLHMLDASAVSPVVTLPVNAARLLQSLEPSSERWVHDAWRTLRQMMLRASGFEGPTGETNEAIKALIKFGGNHGLNTFLSGMPAKLSELSFSAMHAPEAFLDIIETVIRPQKSKRGLPKVVIHLPATDFLNLALLASRRPLLTDAIRPNQPEEIPVELARMLTTEAETDAAGVEQRFLLIESAYGIQNWTPLVDAGKRIADLVTPSPSLSVVLRIVGRLAKSDPSIGTTMADRPNFQLMVQRLADIDDGSAVALARSTALVLIYGRLHALRGPWDHCLEMAPELPSMIQNALDEFGDDQMLAIVSATRESPDFIPVARALVGDAVEAKYFNKADLSPFLSMFDALCVCFGPKPGKGLAAVSHAPRFWSLVATLPSDKDRLQILRTYLAQDSKELGKAVADSVKRATMKELTSVDAPGWVDSIRGQSGYLLLAGFLSKFGGALPETNFHSVAKALESTVEDLFYAELSDIVTGWFGVSKLLGVNPRNRAYQQLWQKLHLAPPKRAAEVLTVGKQAFIKQGKGCWDADAWLNNIRSRSANDGERIAVLSAHPTFYGKMIDAASNEAFVAFREFFQMLHDSATAEDQKMVAALAFSFGTKRKIFG